MYKVKKDVCTQSHKIRGQISLETGNLRNSLYNLHQLKEKGRDLHELDYLNTVVHLILLNISGTW